MLRNDAILIQTLTQFRIFERRKFRNFRQERSEVLIKVAQNRGLTLNELFCHNINLISLV